MSVTVPLAAARTLATRVLSNSRVAPDNAECVARALVAAEADGLASHGLSRVPAYADQAISGKVDGFAEPQLNRSAAAVINIDARFGFTFPAIERGLAAAGPAVGEAGMVALAIANSHHFGVAGHHVERAAEGGLAAIAFSNTPAAIAPWGGTKALYGTNPIAFAWPRPGRAPLVVDLSVSTVARGKLVLAAKSATPVPADWALGADGRATTDAAAGLEGSMTPLGGAVAGAKGAALAMMIELLCGGLTGSNFGYQASSFFDADGPPPAIGHLFLLLDPARFAGSGGFAARGEALFGEILAQSGTRLPGDQRLHRRQAAARDGLALPDDLHADLLARAQATGQ